MTGDIEALNDDGQHHCQATARSTKGEWDATDQGKAAENRRRIVETAARLFRRDGIDNVAVADLMKEAGFTHGGFYNHFQNKDELAKEAIAYAFDQFAGGLSLRIAQSQDPAAMLAEAFANYLSPTHRDALEGGCPTAALPIDSARHEEAIQSAFADGLETYLAAFTQSLGTSGPLSREQAMGVLSQLVGALILSRAVRKGRPELSTEWLSAAKATIHQFAEESMSAQHSS